MPRHIHLAKHHRRGGKKTGRSHSHIKESTRTERPINWDQLNRAAWISTRILADRLAAERAAKATAPVEVVEPATPPPVSFDTPVVVDGPLTECRRHKTRFETTRCTTCRRIVKRIGRETGKCPIHPAGAYSEIPCAGCASARNTRTANWDGDQIVFSTETT